MELIRRAKAEAALGGRKLRELAEEALRLRLGMKKEAKPASAKRVPLLQDLEVLPIIKGRPNARKIKITPKRIHELEMEAE